MSARAWTGFAAVSVLWGIPYLFIKIAVDDGVSPLFLSWCRLALGAVVLLAVAQRAGVLHTVRRRLRWIAVFALAELACPLPLIAVGEGRVSSSLAAILVATVPLIVALLSLRFDPGERLGGRRLTGLLVGFAGVVALVGIDVGGSGEELLGVGAILLAAIGYSAGPVIISLRLTDLDPRATMAVAMTLATVFLTPFMLADPPQTTPDGETLALIAALGIFCTAGAYVLFGALIAEIGASRATVITYISPTVALALGVTLLHERPGPGAIAGLLLILAGSWMSTDGRLPPGLTSRIDAMRIRRRRYRRTRASDAPLPKHTPAHGFVPGLAGSDPA